MQMNNTGQKTAGRCHWCGRQGHYERECRIKMAGKPRKGKINEIQSEEDGGLEEEELAALLAAGGSVQQLGQTSRRGQGFRLEGRAKGSIFPRRN